MILLGDDGAAPAAWGSSPCPLAPKAYRDVYGSVPVHAELAVPAGVPGLVLGDLDAQVWPRLPWPTLPEPLFRVLRQQLAGLPVPDALLAVPSGASRRWLLGLPFRTRTRNCLVKELRVQGPPPEDRLVQPLSAEEVLAWRSAGKIVLIDLLCVVEGASARPSGVASGSAGVEVDELPRPAGCQGGADEALDPAEPGRAAGGACTAVPDPGRGALGDLLAAAREAFGARTLHDAVHADLAALARATGIGEELRTLKIDRLPGTTNPLEGLLDAIDDLKRQLPSRELAILEDRLCAGEPRTLESLGSAMGVTRERVRQLERRLKARIEQTVGRQRAVVAGILRLKLEPILSPEELDLQIRRAFGDSEHPALPLACRMVRNELVYRQQDGICFRREARDVVSLLRAQARRLADDAGLLDEAELEALLPEDSWRRHWPHLVKLCGFHRIDGFLGLRNTKKALVKASVLRLGRVATREEIAERSGLTVQRVTSYLSALPSVARADRTRWGLSEWIDDTYDGVAGEILQRIDEDGGATSVARLLEELPRRFGLKEGTIRAYLGTPQFAVRNGRVVRADANGIRLRSLDDVVDGRDRQGRPFWRFRVEERFFRGHSLAGVPPEIARSLGCEPNGRIEAQVLHPAGCRPVSVSWRLTSLGGASLGHLSEPLRQLGAVEGDLVRVILRGPGNLEFHRDPGARPSVESLLDRMKRRRKVVW